MEFEKSSWDSDDLLSACLDSMLDQSLTVAEGKIYLSDEDYLLITRDALREVGVHSQCLGRTLEYKGALYRLHLLEVGKAFFLARGVMTHWQELASSTVSRLGATTGGLDMSQMEHMTEEELGLKPEITVEDQHNLHTERTLALLETLRLRSVAIMERALLGHETEPAVPRTSLPRL